MSNERETYELMARVAAMEADINNMSKWDDHQSERIFKLEEQMNSKIEKLEEKIDRIIENEKKLLETINDTDSSLAERIDSRFNKIQMWLLGTTATAGIGLLMFILENLLSK